MPNKSFIINVYDVCTSDDGTPFADAIDVALSLPLGERERTVRGRQRRVEHHDKRAEGYLLTFATFAFAGPGRVRTGTPIISMGLSSDEFYADDTAALYDPVLNMAFIESTLSGMLSGAIGDYFQKFAEPSTGTEYQLIPRLDDEAATRARKFQTIRSLEMRVSMGPVTSIDQASGVSPIKAFGEDFDAGTIDITLNARRERTHSLFFGKIWGVLDAISGDGNRNNVTRLVIGGKEDDETPKEFIDLIQHRERRTLSLPVDATERRIFYGDRWKALIQIRNDFTV